MSAPLPQGVTAEAAAPHRTAALLSIGDELALGQTTDTNSAWLADRLALAGVRTIEHATVDDEEHRIAAAMDRLAIAADVLILTGGLGPTADDLTRFALAELLGHPRDGLVLDNASLEAIRVWFARRPGGMPEANAIQAMRPPGSVCLPNPHGTAPGLFARDDRRACDVFCLPGPPREMKPMFVAETAPRLRAATDHASGVRLLLTFGLGESTVAERLGDLMDRDRPSRGLPLVGTTASRGVVTCRLRAEAAGTSAVATQLDDAEADIRARLGPAVFDRRDPARGDGLDIADALPRAVLSLLAHRGERVAVAESCTGGLLAETITDVPGSSAGFWGGWLTYANEAKSSLLGVDPALIDSRGAVSAEVAAAMASGAVDRSGADHALAITGVAGPDGGTDAKPVGTVWIAHASKMRSEARRFQFRGGRAAVREWSARAALGMLRLALIDQNMPLLGEVERATPDQ